MTNAVIAHRAQALAQLEVAAELDQGLTDRSPMSSDLLCAGHTNMQSVIMIGQVYATLELAEQAKRIADALERAQECVSAQTDRWRWRSA
jgi:hypothetical protein